VLLSSLEANSMLLPLSGPVLHSLWRRPGGWLAYYVVSTLVAGVPLLLLALLAAASSTFAAALIGAPVIAAALFLFARLLGRLGWLISQPQTQSAARKSMRSRRRKASVLGMQPHRPVRRVGPTDFASLDDDAAGDVLLARDQRVRR